MRRRGKGGRMESALRSIRGKTSDWQKIALLNRSNRVKLGGRRQEDKAVISSGDSLFRDFKRNQAFQIDCFFYKISSVKSVKIRNCINWKALSPKPSKLVQAVEISKAGPKPNSQGGRIDGWARIADACLARQQRERPLRENQISQFPLCSAPPSFASLLSWFSSTRNLFYRGHGILTSSVPYFSVYILTAFGQKRLVSYLTVPYGLSLIKHTACKSHSVSTKFRISTHGVQGNQGIALMYDVWRS